MAITIKPALRKNPQDKAAAAKYYAQVVLAPEMKQKQIVDQIADRCTLTGSDIKAVLDALMVVIKRNLANGSPVRLGDLGSFRPSVSGKGTEDASKCGASSVKKARVIYVPSAEIKEAVSMYSFSVSVSAILSCRPFFILIFLRCIKMKHYGFSRKSIWKNLETFP